MAGISASNRSRNPAGRESNCSWRVHTGGGKRGVRNAKIGNVLAYGQATNGAMAKRRPWMESAHPIDPETPWVESLIVVGGCVTGAGSEIRKSEVFCLADRQPMELRKNGDHGWILRIK